MIQSLLTSGIHIFVVPTKQETITIGARLRRCTQHETAASGIGIGIASAVASGPLTNYRFLTQPSQPDPRGRLIYP